MTENEKVIVKEINTIIDANDKFTTGVKTYLDTLMKTIIKQQKIIAEQNEFIEKLTKRINDING